MCFGQLQETLGEMFAEIWEVHNSKFKIITPQSGHSEIRTPRYRGQFLLSVILHLCTFQPLKSGHPTNQDTFWGPKVSGIEGFHCNTCLACDVDYSPTVEGHRTYDPSAHLFCDCEICQGEWKGMDYTDVSIVYNVGLGAY